MIYDKKNLNLNYLYHHWFMTYKTFFFFLCTNFSFRSNCYLCYARCIMFHKQSLIIRNQSRACKQSARLGWCLGIISSLAQTDDVNKRVMIYQVTECNTHCFVDLLLTPLYSWITLCAPVDDINESLNTLLKIFFIYRVK